MINELHNELPDKVMAMLGAGSISLQELMAVLGTTRPPRMQISSACYKC